MISSSIFIYSSLQYDTDTASAYPKFPRVKNSESQIAVKIGQIGTGIQHTITSTSMYQFFHEIFFRKIPKNAIPISSGTSSFI